MKAATRSARKARARRRTISWRRSKHEAVEVKDDIVTARVQAQLKGMKGLNIGVRTNDGVVSLTGDVDTLMNSAKASWKHGR